MSFWVKTNYFIKKIFPNYVWDIPNNENKVFLTFDDGPIPKITEWTLEQLKKYDAKATFFCIGNNIEKHPEIFKNIITQGHAIGNHTFNHLNGWKNSTEDYIKNVKLCQSQIPNPKFHTIDSEPAQQTLNLFRPPYGKIKASQSKILRKLGYKIIMWDILSYDFDQTISPEKCLDNVLKNVVNGSIIIFHDNIKAEQNLKYALPKTLAFLKEKGFVCAKID
ncbi:MAG: polysaccharide deacetylase family protein [Flavobacterium sp.]|uniref:polysaccharide deacetylase family protein n=1 Tax=Flavobacterium sp. TaxID=239 RepID=UPI003BE872CC